MGLIVVVRQNVGRKREMKGRKEGEARDETFGGREGDLNKNKRLGHSQQHTYPTLLSDNDLPHLSRTLPDRSLNHTHANVRRPADTDTDIDTPCCLLVVADSSSEISCALTLLRSLQSVAVGSSNTSC